MSEGVFLSMKDFIIDFLENDLGWFLLGIASILWLYGMLRQLITQEGYWDDGDYRRSSKEEG
jgi:hypothetical protein|tara:strand:- start:3789 stop:3974 length:186 start_codon:yes stop_codon:yes gene_type:complete